MKKYAVIDIETTGGLTKRDRITEIAIILFDGTKVIDQFDTLIYPERSIPPEITRITGITDQMQLHFRSWTYWQFKYYNDITALVNPGYIEAFYDKEGHLQERKIKALARPYAYAICGTPIR